MRIIAGTHRGRRLETPQDERIRPTSDRIREALFNILHHRMGGLSGKCVLDGFAGTGALGLEALSRGAHFALFVDRDREALALCKRNVTLLGLAERAGFRLDDVTCLPSPERAFDLIFLDPPYGQGLAHTALGALDRGGWLAVGALAVVESDIAQPESPSPGFTVTDSRDYGRTRIALLMRDGSPRPHRG